MFRSVTAFDLHQVGLEPVVCRDPASVKRLKLRDDGTWSKNSGPAPAHWAGGAADDSGAVDLTTLVGVLSALCSLVALGLALTAAAALGALTLAVTAAVSGAAVSVVVVCALLRRWSR